MKSGRLVPVFPHSPPRNTAFTAQADAFRRPEKVPSAMQKAAKRNAIHAPLHRKRPQNATAQAANRPLPEPEPPPGPTFPK